MPRSGSTWVHNVTRAVFRAAGYQVFPEQVPQEADDMFAHADHAIADTDPNKIWILKVHRYLRPDAPLSKFINTQRDLRDALVSFMRFMQSDFEQALKAMIESAEKTDHYYRHFSPESILHLRYADITAQPFEVVRTICGFCNATLTETQIENIVARFEKANVERLIHDKEVDLERRARSGGPIARTEFVPQRFQPDMARAFDPATGFQSGHLSGYCDGDWRKLLTAEQQERIHIHLGEWLRRYGYADNSGQP
jgi:hypothetical protein